MESRIEDLEVRSAHQEQAVEELSRELREQQRLVEELRVQVRHLSGMLKAMTPSNIADESQEAPPPHY